MAQADWNAGAAYGPGSAGARGGDGRLAAIIGAASSLALIAGLALWGYQLAVRDVTGVPVVRALEGPMRIQPEDPGGEAAAHLGYAVNAVQAEGGAEAPPARVILAPPPVEPARDDMVARAAAPAPVAEEASAVRAAAQVAPEMAGVEAQDAVARAAMDARPAEGAAPRPRPRPAAAAAALAVARAAALPAHEAVPEETVATPAASVIPASVPGVARSPRPAHRPARLARPATAGAAAGSQAPAFAQAVAAAVADAMPASVPASVPEIGGDAVPPGTRLVQLGAFDSPKVARAAWDRLAGRFGDYLDGKTRVIAKARSGGKTFYRLRAMGFDDFASAQRLCTALKAGGAECVPVVSR